MRAAPALIVSSMFAGVVGTVSAKLPPLTEEAKVQATENTAKSAWADKVAQYQLCRAMDRTVEAYRSGLKWAGKPVPTVNASAPCADPGPYVSQMATKPLEAAGAHSPPETAASPPTSALTAAEIATRSKN